jgi:hypothetical protein
MPEHAMKPTQQSRKHATGGKPGKADDSKADSSDADSGPLDEALDESFPASDPVAISITSIEPGGAAAPPPAGVQRN